MHVNRDQADILFRGLFCLIFIGLGGEHIVDDRLIQKLMPGWVPAPRLISILCGVWLMFGGVLILLGWQLRIAAFGLATFLVLVTLVVHLPGIFSVPASIPAELSWTWDILQRTNLVKNLCLLGVCFHLQHHEVGKYSLSYFLANKKKATSTS